MALLRIPQSLAWLALALVRVASAETLPIDSLSFGHHGELTPHHAIPGWRQNGYNHAVQVMRNGIILTPPVPGNAKGALWSEAPVGEVTDWTAQLEFRASGQEMGSGNLQFWYTQNPDTVGVNSVYNVEKFDGLVIVIDQYGGSGGKIRGFLNDGSVNFLTSAFLESLAFGHCDYSYRNLGRPSKLKITNQGGLTVTIDDKTCFSSNQIALPAGNNYHFGLTATTGENPDSFEVQSFAVTAGGDLATGTKATTSHPKQGEEAAYQKMSKMDTMPGAPEMLPDRDADSIKSQADQFADLHNRLQGLSHHMGTLYYEIKTISDKLDTTRTEVVQKVGTISGVSGGGSRDTGIPPETVGKINALHDRVSSIESVVNIIRNDLEGKDYKQSMDELHTAMSFLHHNFHTGMDGKLESGKFIHNLQLRLKLGVEFVNKNKKLTLCVCEIQRSEHMDPVQRK